MVDIKTRRYVSQTEITSDLIAKLLPPGSISGVVALPKQTVDVQVDYDVPGAVEDTDDILADLGYLFIEDEPVTSLNDYSKGENTTYTAEDIGFTPSNPGDWSPAPDDVAEGLDQIASIIGGSVGDLPVVQARRTTTYAMTGTATNITFDATDVENQPGVVEHDNTNTDRLVAKEAGLYLAAFGLNWSSNGLCSAEFKMRLNNSSDIPGGGVVPVEREPDDDTPDDPVTRLCLVVLSANDFITLSAERLTGSGTNLTVNTTLQLIKLRGTQGPQGPAGAGSTVIVQDEGVNVPNTPHSTLDFQGDGVVVTDGGSGKAIVTVDQGGVVHYDERTTLLTNGSSSFFTYLATTTPSLEAGNYIISWNVLARMNVTNDDIEIRVEVDNTQAITNPGGDGIICEEFKDTGPNQRYTRGGFRRVTLTAGTHDIDIDFRPRDDADTAYMYFASIKVEKAP